MHDKPLPPLTPSTRAHIAANVRRLRIEKALSQEELGELADFHRTYVSMLERCHANISIDGLERIAQALEVSAADLLQPPPAN